MYKIEIQLTKENENNSKLTATEVINNNTTKFEKAMATILKDYIIIALDEFSKELEKDDELAEVNDEELKNLIKDLTINLEELKETIKDKKKED